MSARSTASARICCANGRWRRGSTRCSRSSPSPASARLFDEAFDGWLQEQLADPREGVRRALRRTRAFGGDGRPRSIACGRRRGTSPQWRDFTDRLDAAAVRPRSNRSSRRWPKLHEFAALTRHPTSTNDPLHVGHRADRVVSATRSSCSRSSGDRRPRLRRLGGGARRSLPGSDPRQREDRPRRLVREWRRPRPRARRRVSRSAPGSISSGWTPTPISRRCLQRELRGAIDRVRRAEGAGGRARLPRPAAQCARSGPRQRRRSGSGSRRASSASSSTSSRTRIRCRPRSCCCSPPTIPPRRDWRRASPVPGTLFIVGDPKQSIYRFRRADVGVYREVCERLEALGADSCT